jgi:heptosyltransferase-2
VRIVVLGSAEERALLERVARGIDPPRVDRQTGPDPADLPRIAGRCPVALTNDSGILHVAEACGAAAVAIFGPTHPRLGFAPLDPRSLTLHTGIPCSPCDVHGPERCPRGHHRCMEDLPPERVLEEVVSRLPREGTRC